MHLDEPTTSAVEERGQAHLTASDDLQAYIQVRFPALAVGLNARHAAPLQAGSPAASDVSRTPSLPPLSARFRGGGGGAGASPRQLAAASKIAASPDAQMRLVDERKTLQLLESYPISLPKAGARPYLHGLGRDIVVQSIEAPAPTAGCDTLLQSATRREDRSDAAIAPIAAADELWTASLRAQEGADRRIEQTNRHPPAVRAAKTHQPTSLSAEHQHVVDAVMKSTAISTRSRDDASAPALPSLIKQDGGFEGQHSYEELAVPTESNSDLAAALKRQAAWLCDVFQQKLRRQHDYFTALLSDAGKTAEANEHKKLSELRTAFVEQSTANAALVHDCDALKARAHTLQRELEAARAQLFESDAALQRRISELTAIRSNGDCADAPCQTELSMADIVELMEHARETSRCASAHDIATSTVVEHLPSSLHAELVPLSLPQRADNVVLPMEPARGSVEATDAGTRTDNTESHAPLQLDYHEIGLVVPSDDGNDVDWLLDAENAATETPPVPRRTTR
jgi:hypothetical protein